MTSKQIANYFRLLNWPALIPIIIAIAIIIIAIALIIITIKMPGATPNPVNPLIRQRWK